MLTPEILKPLLREVFSSYYSKVRGDVERVEKEPETCAIALLLALLEELSFNGTADGVVLAANYRYHLKKAREILGVEEPKA